MEIRKKFDEICTEFRNAVVRIEHISEITLKSLENFPDNLSENLKEGLERDLAKIRNKEIKDEDMYLETSIIRMYFDFETSVDLGIDDFLKYYLSLIRAHQLVMIYANLESYLSDIAEIAHQIDSQVLISDKK